MFLNQFASTLSPHDMTATDEFASLLVSASELGIAHSTDVRYQSRQTILGGHRFHFSEWGEPGNPVVLFLHGGSYIYGSARTTHG